ncbi:Glycosyl hydrolases family 43 [Mucilaginibacter lappiensis]|uniref:Beta-xylosidase n=1 Tax=Mucilaginibacter lappiensis TaxID=354630 RepID=A0ABR6PQH3_9SPHI|nr:family 43 glycosylhydrolase [Mucilaginibacter lappiensis]MBB6111970.1 beta-xylosidase [Mucilaginibacter lappiensis]SIR91188.1 Glycosyl hydrolases family 43 [Mucilaginibacter lappiensis]
MTKNSNTKSPALILLFFITVFNCLAQEKLIKNPITQGYYADPTVIKDKGVYYIYATIDPWGGKELGVLETKDFKTFVNRHINWPTKKACTSPTSGDAMVWAPSVRKFRGKFYMYVAVGSEIWVGVSDDPLGPWKNAKSDNSPLITKTDFPQVHNIDADCFIDDNGDAYLYWGSGFNWVNGHCMAVKLKKDMITFDGVPQEITPPHYFEAPHMVKRNGIYYLMYSYGKAIDGTYQVRYSTGKTPLGPWTEGAYDPILSTTPDSTTLGPGHHTVFKERGQYYILYHRIHPQKEQYVLRELCLDSLNFDRKGDILKIKPLGVSLFRK